MTDAKEIDDLLTRAATATADERLAKASNLLERALTLDPSRGETHARLADALSGRGRHERAAVQYQIAIRLARSYYFVHAGTSEAALFLGLGKAYRAAGKHTEALAVFKNAVQQRPAFAEAHDEAGQTYREKGPDNRPDLDAALREYAAAVVADPRFIRAQLHWAEVLQERGDDAGALGHLVDALGVMPDDPEVHAALTRVMRRLPDRAPAITRIQGILDGAVTGAPAHLAWGHALQALGQRSHAHLEFLRALKLGSGNGPDADLDVFAALVDTLPEAPGAPDFQPIEAVLAEKADARARAAWGQALTFRDGLQREAIGQLLVALQQDVDQELPYSAIGSVLASDPPRDLLDSTIARGGAAVEASQSPRAHARWAVMLSGIENAGDATARAFARAVAILEERPQPAATDQLAEVIGVVRSLGDLARPHLDTLGLLVDRTSEARLMQQWAEVLLDFERTADALNRLERALARDSAVSLVAYVDGYDAATSTRELEERLARLVTRSIDASTHRQWGAKLLGRERHQEALAATLRATELDGDDAKAWRQAGEVCAKLNDIERALTHFERSIEADPTIRETYAAWAAALASHEEAHGAAARLAEVLGGAELPAAERVPWSAIEALRAKTTDRVSRLVDTVEHNLDRSDAWAYVSAGADVYRLGYVTHARRLFAQAVAYAPDDYWAEIDLGLTAARLYDFPAAIEAYDHAIAQRPDGLLAYVERARAHVSMRKPREACGDFALALEKGTDPDPHTPDGRLARARCLGYWASALSAAGDHEGAIEKARAALAGQDDQETRFWLGMVLANAGLGEEAVAAYERAIEVARDQPYAHHNIASRWSDQVRARIALPKWEEVRRLYQKGLAAAIRARDADYCGYYGEMCREVFADYTTAEVLLRVARLLAPTDAGILTAVIRYCLERQRALDRRPIGSDSWDSGFSETRARLRLQAAETYATAVRLLNQTLPRDDTGTKQRGALLQLGDLHLLMDDVEKAEAALRQVVAVEESVMAVKMLGEAYLGLGRYPEAIQKLKAAQRLAPDDLHVRVLLGRALLKSGALDEARQVFDDVLDIARFHVHAMLGLGEVYLDMADKRAGEQDGAIREELYTRAIETLTKAIETAQSPDRPIGMHVPPASAYYLRGYARVKIWETRRRAWERYYVRDALRDFQACLALEPRHVKAAQAIGRAKEARARSRSSFERAVPPLIVSGALLVLLIAHVGFLIGLPTWPPTVTLSADSFASLRAANVSADVVLALKPMEGVRFRSDDALLVRAKALVDDKRFEPLKSKLALHSVRGEPERDLARLDSMAYGLLTFGGLIFLVAGAYLPQLTSLRFAGLQLEKSTADRGEAVYALGIGREETGGRSRLGMAG